MNLVLSLGIMAIGTIGVFGATLFSLHGVRVSITDWVFGSSAATFLVGATGVILATLIGS